MQLYWWIRTQAPLLLVFILLTITLLRFPISTSTKRITYHRLQRLIRGESFPSYKSLSINSETSEYYIFTSNLQSDMYLNTCTSIQVLYNHFQIFYLGDN